MAERDWNVVAKPAAGAGVGLGVGFGVGLGVGLGVGAGVGGAAPHRTCRSKCLPMPGHGSPKTVLSLLEKKLSTKTSRKRI
jgi:hypothetical protein